MNLPRDHAASESANGQHLSSAADARPTRSRRRLGPRVAGLVIGASLGLLLPLALVIYFRSAGQLPGLTSERLAAAESQWRSQGASSYEMDIRIGGRQPGLVHIEVRDGQTTAMTRDGVTPKRRATWDAWSVPSMFDTLEIELAGAANPAKAFGAPADARVIELAEFDPQLGYPRAYQRSILGTTLDMSWQVAQFRPLTGAAASTPPTPAGKHP